MEDDPTAHDSPPSYHRAVDVNPHIAMLRRRRAMYSSSRSHYLSALIKQNLPYIVIAVLLILLLIQNRRQQQLATVSNGGNGAAGGAGAGGGAAGAGAKSAAGEKAEAGKGGGGQAGAGQAHGRGTDGGDSGRGGGQGRQEEVLQPQQGGQAQRGAQAQQEGGAGTTAGAAGAAAAGGEADTFGHFDPQSDLSDTEKRRELVKAILEDPNSKVAKEVTRNNVFREHMPTFGFVQFASYRMSESKFAVVGLASRVLKTSRELGRCLWKEKHGGHRVTGAARGGKELEMGEMDGIGEGGEQDGVGREIAVEVRGTYYPGDDHNKRYEAVVLVCELEESTAQDFGGILVVTVDKEDIVSYIEDQGQYPSANPAPALPPPPHLLLAAARHEAHPHADPEIMGLIEGFVEGGYVQIVDMRRVEQFDIWESGRLLAMNDCVHQHAFTSQWVFFAELSEYFSSRSGEDMAAVLSRFEGRPYVSFGSRWWSLEKCVQVEGAGGGVAGGVGRGTGGRSLLGVAGGGGGGGSALRAMGNGTGAGADAGADAVRTAGTTGGGATAGAGGGGGAATAGTAGATGGAAAAAVAGTGGGSVGAAGGGGGGGGVGASGGGAGAAGGGIGTGGAAGTAAGATTAATTTTITTTTAAAAAQPPPAVSPVWAVERMRFHWPQLFCTNKDEYPRAEMCLGEFGYRRVAVDPRQVMTVLVHRTSVPEMGGDDLDASEARFNRYPLLTEETRKACQREVRAGEVVEWWVRDAEVAEIAEKARKSPKGRPRVGSELASARR
ncbi:unnamed protein product [Closterium sp. NIES-65]|nr:unnamed protein product [Closterium sp. NIES-65]